jgi:hypothetical protein
MVSTKLGPRLCETTYGGKFVPIPGFPGEKIDRRLLSDIKFLTSRYRIFITDGYSDDPVHAENGEHPIGLALDIIPSKAAGGTWNDVDRLAKWAEPRQDHPRAPFRWVGYDGDAGHGRGDHLHLSWNHSMVKPFRPAPTVYTLRCPSLVPGVPKPPKPPKPPDGGGTTAGEHGNEEQPYVGSSGGLGRGGAKRAAGRPVAETGGVGTSATSTNR